MGFNAWDSELGAEENQEESEACDSVGNDLEEEREEFSFHGIQAVKTTDSFSME